MTTVLLHSGAAAPKLETPRPQVKVVRDVYKRQALDNPALQPIGGVQTLMLRETEVELVRECFRWLFKEDDGDIAKRRGRAELFSDQINGRFRRVFPRMPKYTMNTANAVFFLKMCIRDRLTAALLAAADFLLVDDVHSYSRVTVSYTHLRHRRSARRHRRRHQPHEYLRCPPGHPGPCQLGQDPGRQPDRCHQL